MYISAPIRGIIIVVIVVIVVVIVVVAVVVVIFGGVVVIVVVIMCVVGIVVGVISLSRWCSRIVFQLFNISVKNRVNKDTNDEWIYHN